MRRLAGFLTVFFLATLLLTVPALALEPGDLSANSAVLMDADTGQVLFEKSPQLRREPASITKILTCLLVLEQGDTNDWLTVSEEAADVPLYSSRIALRPGERVRVDDALYGMMLPSANDAANALAEYVAGSQRDFAELMNRRAAEIGAEKTHFTNPHGLPDENHYTTAYDMALITREACRNEEFMRYFGTGRHTMAPTNLSGEERYFTNQQFMLLPDQWWAYSEDVTGGKVGYTTEAGHTMSTVATRNGRTLVCVVMNAGRDEKFYDTQALLDYGFTEFQPYSLSTEALDSRTVPIEEGGAQVGSVFFSLEEEPVFLLHRSLSPSQVEAAYQFPDSLSRDGDMTASVTFSVSSTGQKGLPTLLLTVPMEAEVTYFSHAGMVGDGEGEALSLRILPLATLFRGFLILMAVVLAVLVLLLLIRARNLRRRRQRRTARRRRTPPPGPGGHWANL